MPAGEVILLVIKNWWWLMLPIALWFPAKFFYLWWLSWHVWYPKFQWNVLEIKPPKEILKPFKAMENVYAGLWGIIDSPNWRERWCEGQLVLGGGLWFSFEIASIGGNIHFYIRVPKHFRETAESTIYAQYPDVEIFEVEDYTKNIPKDIPNKDWEVYSEDYQFKLEDPWPIKTYPKFFEERPEMPKEEKRIDPMDPLLEGFSKVAPGEQLWMQIGCIPIFDRIVPFVTRGQEIKNKLIKRPQAKKKPMVQEAVDVLLTGQPEEEIKPTGIGEAPIEFKLTPGERETLASLENKITKPGYSCWIRMVHVYRKDQPHLRGKQYMIRSFFQQFQTENMNAIGYLGVTRTRMQYLLTERRLYMRKKRQLRNYISRFPPYYPKMTGKPTPDPLLKIKLLGESKGPGFGRGTMVLNIEELATIFHLPTKVIVPGVPYVEAKKAGPPTELPVE